MAQLSTTHLDISQLPSLVKDGMSVSEEAMKRRKTCRFIEESGRILKLPRLAIATAMVFFHRFYAKHAFSDHDRFEVAVASIVLAAKTEESPKKLNIVIEECYKLKMRGMQAGRISVGPNSGNNSTSDTLDPQSEEFTKLKERILLLERVLLHTIGFELSIDHPYRFLVEQIKNLVQGRKLEFTTEATGSNAESIAGANKQETKKLTNNQIRDKMMNQLVQWAMNFANDSMHTSLCLQVDPQQVATACVYLAFQFADVQPVNNTDYLEVLGQPDVETLASISYQIIELIAERKGAEQTILTKIRTHMEALQNVKGSTGQDISQEQDAKRPRLT